MCPQDKKTSVFLKVHVQPKASRETLVSYVHDVLKIKVKSPPVDGEANAACISFLAGLFGIARKDLSIKSGHKARLKMLEIKGITSEEIRRLITARIAGN